MHSADGWREVLEPVIIRYRGIVKRLYFRGDAAFANPEIYEFLETEGIGYTIEVAVSRQMFQEILVADRPAAGTARASMRRLRSDVTGNHGRGAP